MQQDFPERTIVHVLERRLRDCPEKPWIVAERPWSYREMDRLSNRLARGLLASGVAPGDTLLVMLPNCVELVAAWVACAKTGIVEVPINTAYRGDILAHVVNDSNAKAMIVGGQYLDRVQGIAADLKSLRRCFVLGEQPSTGGGLETMPFDTLLKASDNPMPSAPRESDLMAVMYTSGTTGNSKGVMVSHAHAHEYAVGCGEAIGLEAEDVYYTAGLPLFHVAGKWGVLNAAAIQGATAVVPPSFSAREFWNDVRRTGSTATYLLGAMANFLQRQPPAPDDADNSLRKILMCPLLPDLDAFTRRFDVRVATAYGSTEVNSPMSMPIGTKVTDSQVVGRERAGKFEVRIIDEEDRPVPDGTPGEIAVRPLQPWIAMLGYWNQPEATARMWRNLWLHSGDAGRRDPDGTLYFTDRLKDAIRRRGENISSMEVEGIIGQHPAVLECAVLPVRSEYGEEEVMAMLVLREGKALAPKDLIRYLEPRMAHFMVPRYLDFVPELPKTPTGKIRKAVLREAGLTPTTWDREAAGIKVAR